MCAGPYQEDDATHATHASRSSAHQLLLPAAGSDGRPIGVGLRAAAGVRRHTGGGASTSSGKGVVNDRVVQLAKQLTDSGVPLELATARAEIQVRPLLPFFLVEACVCTIRQWFGPSRHVPADMWTSNLVPEL